jgi:dTDP-4-amino-4,6-dideoxygalactose transaminase
MNIGFNKPYLSGKEMEYISQAVAFRKISGDGMFTKRCHEFFERKYGFKKVLLTTSCTDALEMAAILVDIKEGDEVIAPAYTFVSTVNAFVLRGAKIVFVDSSKENPNLDAEKIEALITARTKVLLPVHYAGIACNMEKIMALANKYNLFVVEDAAQAVDSFFNGKPLGCIGHMAAFSFHETKNIISGEGGMLVINDARFAERAEIIREKGTNRSMFFRGEVDKYGWVDIGSSFLPSDIIAAFLYAQLENLEAIQFKRKEIWEHYYSLLKPLEQKGIQLPFIPTYASNNAHMFYLICRSELERASLIEYLKTRGIHTVFHYLSLNKSAYYKKQTSQMENLVESDRYTTCLLRLPMYYELTENEIDFISQNVIDYFDLHTP